MGDSEVRTAAVVLAAGLGTRFGGGKMLAEIGGRPLLQHVLDLAASLGLDPIVVVLGDDADQVEAAIAWRHEVRVRNPAPGRGLSSSLALGLDAIRQGGRALILLGDQPLLSLENVRVITNTSRDPARPIVVPRYGGVPGNPVMLEREAWPLARELRGDRGMSQLFATHSTRVRYVDVNGTNPDIDTRSDLASLAKAPEGIRRQVHELTLRDLQLYPLWEFALDEEGEPGQDEATVRPVPGRLAAHNGDVVRATFVAADGTRFTGYATPHTWATPSWLQPTIVSERGQVNFWLGWREAGIAPGDLTADYELLGTTAARLFPITYQLDVPWNPASNKDELAQLRMLGAPAGELFPNSRWLARSPDGKLVGRVPGFMWFSEPGGEHKVVS